MFLLNSLASLPTGWARRVCRGGFLFPLAWVWWEVFLLGNPWPARTAPEPCGAPREGRPVALAPLLRPAAVPAADPTRDYRHRLQTTAFGWPLQTPWCVWVEPNEEGGASSAIHQRWHKAVTQALAEWRGVLPIHQVPVPERAQVTIWRRRPPLGLDATGRSRASHGRAILTLQSREQRLEPRVRVLISPGQRQEAIQATALHELGHAFGLWGHSDDGSDAMAIAPGPQPILRLSPRDRATVRWLYAQPAPLRSDP